MSDLISKSKQETKRQATIPSDRINRRDAIKSMDNAIWHYPNELYTGLNSYEMSEALAKYGLMFLPSAEPGRLTDDDFETIRIHLNAYKEKLCNQQRWEEAEEYQRIIDRFMAFASAEPERKTAEWIYGENGGQDGWYCSKCGLFIPWDYEYYGLDNIDFIADFHTCPKCDRKMLKYTGMRGEQE